jgi:hypothetical protein
MRQLKIEEQKFDIDGFINGTFSYLKKQMNEDVDLSTIIFRVNNIGGVPEFAEEENRDIKKDLDQGLMLLFPFAMSDCDGGAYYAEDGFISYQNEENNPDVEIDEDEVEIPEGLLGELDTLGFLVRKESGYYLVDSAIVYPGASAGPLPSVELLEDVEEFEKLMEDFINRFIKK